MKKHLGILCSIFLFLFFMAPHAFPAEKAKPKEKIQKAPAFPRDGIWLTPHLPDKKFFEGKLTLVYFWDYNSINSIREIGILKKWDKLYHPFGFHMVWIHSPEFSFAARRENVAGAAHRLGIPYPIFLDNDFKLWEAYKVRSWPTKILVNRRREIIYSKAGEGGYVETEKEIRRLLKQLHKGVKLPAAAFQKETPKYSIQSCGLMSSETYLGYKKSEWWGAEIANKQWMPHDKPITFKDRGERVEHGFFAEGLWTAREDDMEHARNTKDLKDYVGMMYVANEVYAVIHQKGDSKDGRVYVTRDGEAVPREFRGRDLEEDNSGKTFVSLRSPRLHYLIAHDDEHFHELKLWTGAEGVAVNSFSFSNPCLSEFDHR